MFWNRALWIGLSLFALSSCGDAASETSLAATGNWATPEAELAEWRSADSARAGKKKPHGTACQYDKACDNDCCNGSNHTCSKVLGIYCPGN